VDAVFRALPIVALPGYSRPLIRVADYLALVEDVRRRSRALRRGLRPAREVDDQHDEQNDDEDPDQSIACSGECEQHGCPPSVVYGGDSELCVAPVVRRLARLRRPPEPQKMNAIYPSARLANPDAMVPGQFPVKTVLSAPGKVKTVLVRRSGPYRSVREAPQGLPVRRVSDAYGRDQHQAAWSKGIEPSAEAVARAKRWWLRRHTLDELRSWPPII
jgi:hypothetical protein